MDVGCRLQAGKGSPDISHILKVKWQLFADGLAAVVKSESRLVQVFHADCLLGRAPLGPRGWGCPPVTHPGPRPSKTGTGIPIPTR